MRFRLACLLCITALPAFPGAAGAATYCVAAPACAGTTEPSLQDALDAAAAVGGPDRIELGPASAAAPLAGGSYDSNDPLEIAGAGRGRTHLAGPGTVLALGSGGASSSVSVSGVTILIQSGVSGPGVRLNGARADQVDISAAADAASPIGVELRNGAWFARGSVSIAASGGTGVVARAGSTRVDETVVDLSTAAPATGVYAGNATGETPVIIDARHMTIAGRGLSGQTGLLGQAGVPGQTVVVNLADSVVDQVDRALGRSASSGTAIINPTYSSFDPARVSDAGGSGGITSSASNGYAGTGWVNGPGGDFRLTAGSPLIDRGSPGGGDSTDVAVGPRLLDGNGDCGARRDIGAFEFSPGSATAVASAAPAAIAGSKVTFDGSASCDPDPGARIQAHHWSFDDGGSAAGAVVQHAFAKPGTHTATLTVTSSSGRTGTRAVTVAVSAPAAKPRRKSASFVLIPARPIKVDAKGIAWVRLRCAGTRRCTGRLELWSARPVSLSAQKRLLKLGSKRFSIPPLRSRNIQIKLSDARLQLVRELEKLRTNVTVRDRDSAGRPRKSVRTVTLRARLPKRPLG
jgi:hypothetical protein